MAEQTTALRYVVRMPVVFKYFGQMCLVLAALTLVPLVMSVIFGDTYQPAFWYRNWRARCPGRERDKVTDASPSAGE